MRRAPSLHQWKTPIEANSAKTSNESNLNTPNLRGNTSAKEIMQEMRMMERVKRTYMQDMPESVHHDSASTDSVQSVIKISKAVKP